MEPQRRAAFGGADIVGRMTGSPMRPCRRGARVRALPVGAALWLALVAPAAADTFNGRIAFSSVRTDPQAKEFDIFSMNPDGGDVRPLTTNPATDRQPDWSPDGTAIAYTIRKPNSTINFEVARMTPIDACTMSTKA